MNRYIIGSLVVIALAALAATVAAGASTARADDIEVEFMEFSFDKKIQINPSNGVFIVRGTVTCEDPDEPGEPVPFSLRGELSQKAGGESITGSFFTSLDCNTEPTQWEAEVFGQFKPGQARIQGFGCASLRGGNFDCDIVSTKAQLKKSKG
jgi:hypothetical protein